MVIRISIIAVLAVLFSVGGVDCVRAEKRIALVIGNSAYKNAARLPNTVNDSAAVELLFKSAKFDVVTAQNNLTATDMRRTLRDFSEQARDADIAVVFYAGHGIEVDGVNYLVPVDAALERDVDVEDETVSLDRILRVLEPAKRLRLVILDACRDNPFATTMQRTIRTRSVGRGLAKVETTSSDTLIAFAAKAGSTASDGNGPNSPFTSAILHHIAEPGLDLRLAFGRIRDDVLSATGRRQEPFVYGSLGGAVASLTPSSEVNSTPMSPAADATAEIRRNYEFAAQIGTIEAWDSFLAAHPMGFFAELASAQRAKLIPLQPQAVAKLPEPVPPAKETSARSAAGFDGKWNVVVDCPKDSSGAGAYTLRFEATVQGGKLAGQNGVAGKPSSLALTGKIEPDGTAKLFASGITGDPKYTVSDLKRGSPYQYDVTAQFKSDRGSGKRDQVRICNYTFSKL